MTKVFLSYDSEDLNAARKIAAGLERAGHNVWWDRHIRGGAEFSEEIDQALEDAQAVVVLWSRKSIKSPWVRDEAAAGRDSGRFVPVRIDDCMPPLGFRQYQTIDGHAAAGIHELRAVISALSETGAGPIGRSATEARGRLTRRNLLMGTGAATVLAGGGAGFLLYRRSQRNEVPEEVQPLLFQAKQAMNENTREGQYQAIALYQRAVQMAPNYANGWGWLGFAYAVVSHYRDRQESLSLKARAEAAGHRALELDPDSPMGEVALSVALPFVGYWAERERHLMRALSLDPHNDEVLILAGVVLQFAGRSSEAVPYYLRVKHRPLTPAEYTNYIRALWSAGRLPELDQAMSDAAALYPTQGSIWFTRLSIAMYGGEVGAVRALVDDVQGRPSGLDDDAVTDLLKLAQAIQSRAPAEIDAIMVRKKASARVSAAGADESITDASALGRIDDAFELAEAYYFGRGFAVPDSPKTSSVSPDQRQTRFLFEPVTKPMRADPRFEALVKELGLDRYWRQSGHPPDYRHIPGL
jgi:tetratricopeptide (TPR) repeat protein